MQHAEVRPDPLLCSCIAYAGLMGQILALEALRDAHCLQSSCFVVQPRFYIILGGVAKASLLKLASSSNDAGREYKYIRALLRLGVA